MPDTFGVGLSALNSLQAAIKTTGQNIANVNTEGYSRQTVDFATNPPDRFGDRFIGAGVYVSNIERAFDEFLTRDVWNRTSSAEEFRKIAETSSRVDELFADPATGIGPAINEFYSSLETVANSPTTLPERELVISTGVTLAERFAYFEDRLVSFQSDLNIQIDAGIRDINQFAESIAALNDQIAFQQASGSGVAAGDLLDQRDQLITELSLLVQTTVQEQGDGALNIFIGQGQPLVVGNQASSLSTAANPVRQNRLDVLLTAPSGFTSDITDRVTEGSVGAALVAYEDVVEQARRDIGVLAAGLTITFNQVHAAGFDLNDATGNNFFDPAAAQPAFAAIAGNTGVTVVDGVNISATIYDPDPSLSGDISQVTGDSYRLSYSSGQLSVLNLTTDQSQSFAIGPGDFSQIVDGVRININAATIANLNNGDQFLLQPTRDAAQNFGVLISDPNEIAAAEAAGSPGDNRNVLALIDLSTQGLLVNQQTYQDAYTNTSSRIAVQTRRAESLAQTEQALLDSATARKSNLTGVSLEEEAANLIRFQQAYQAAAQVVSTARDVFETLIRATE